MLKGVCEMEQIKNTVNKKIYKLVLQEQYMCISKILSRIKEYAIIKGAPLSYYCYHNVSSRGIGDIDLLIDRSQISKVEKIFIEDGFEKLNINSLNAREDEIFLLSYSHQVIPLVKALKYSQIKIDINFDIFWGEYEDARVQINEFLSDSVYVDIYGVKVKTLNPMKSLIHLILHNYKDMNSIFLLATRKSIRYSMFQDIYYLLINNNDKIQIDELYDICDRYHIIKYAFYVFYYTSQLFDDAILKKYVEKFRTPEGDKLLNCYGLCSKEQKEWRYDFKTRLEKDNLYELIKNDLTEKDMKKIAINKRIFSGGRK